MQGNAGGDSYEQINSILWASYGRPGESLEAFVAAMREGAAAWHAEMGGQQPWGVSGVTDVYMVYNDADPWTGPGARQILGCSRSQMATRGAGGGGKDPHARPC